MVFVFSGGHKPNFSYFKRHNRSPERNYSDHVKFGNKWLANEKQRTKLAYVHGYKYCEWNRLAYVCEDGPITSASYLSATPFMHVIMSGLPSQHIQASCAALYLPLCV